MVIKNKTFEQSEFLIKRFITENELLCAYDTVKWKYLHYSPNFTSDNVYL